MEDNDIARGYSIYEQEKKLRVMEDAGRSCRETSKMKFKLAIRELLNITLLIEIVDLFEISRLD